MRRSSLTGRPGRQQGDAERAVESQAVLSAPAAMALGIHWLAAGSRAAVAWFPMLLTGALAGTLFAFDNALRAKSDLGALSGLAGRRCGRASECLAAGRLSSQ